MKIDIAFKQDCKKKNSIQFPIQIESALVCEFHFFVIKFWVHFVDLQLEFFSNCNPDFIWHYWKSNVFAKHDHEIGQDQKMQRCLDGAI